MKTKRQQLISNLADKEYRDSFVEESINSGVAFQIRAMRRVRSWTQGDLGAHVPSPMNQETISRLENANNDAKPNLETLVRLAAAFDVALIVRFAPFHELIDHVTSLMPQDLNVPSYSDDKGLVTADTSVHQQPRSTEGIDLMQALKTGLVRPKSPHSANLVDHVVSSQSTEVSYG